MDPPATALGDVLDALLDDPARTGARVTTARELDELRAGLEAAAAAATAVGGWTDAEPLRLSKRVVSGLLRCPRRAVTELARGDEAGSLSDDVVSGLIVDGAAKLATVSPRQSVTVDSAVAFLTALGNTRVVDGLAVRGNTLPSDVAAKIERLAGGWPVIEPGWWPRVEEPVRVRLEGGAVTVAGRLDVLLGGPPTGRPACVVEVKSGRWHDGMRADAHLYALLVALRDGEAPAVAVTVVADGTTQVEPIRPALLDNAAARLEEAMHIASRLAAGEPPATVAGSHCAHCPVRPDCPAGAGWRPDAAAVA